MLNSKPKSPFELMKQITKNRDFLIKAYFYLLIQYVVLFFGFVFFIFYGFKKPPLLIRDIDGNREVVINYVKDSNKVSKEDVLLFSKKFLDNYYGLRSDYVVPQLEKALNMMTDMYKKNHMQTFKEHQTISKIQSAKIINEVLVDSDIEVENYNSEYLASLKGVVIKRLLNSEEKEKKAFLCTLKLVQVPISPSYPYGLAVDDIDMRFLEINEKLNQSLNEVAK